jgi:ATP-dependent DNA ligase
VLSERAKSGWVFRKVRGEGSGRIDEDRKAVPLSRSAYGRDMGQAVADSEMMSPIRSACPAAFPCRMAPAMRSIGVPSPLPLGFILPCLPSARSKPPTGSTWVHEIKHDGYRLMARRDGKRIRLFTRHGYDGSKRYPLIAEALRVPLWAPFLLLPF